MKLKVIEFDGGNHRKVVTDTGVEVGIFYLDASGFYYWEHSGYGYFASNTLREIADLLDEINKPYNKQVEEYFEKPQIFCKDNVTTCIYFNEGKCEKEPDECRSQSTNSDFLVDEFTGIIYPKEK
jgi:hypothetical protein